MTLSLLAELSPHHFGLVVQVSPAIATLSQSEKWQFSPVIRIKRTKPANVVMHDRDTKFTASFDEILTSNRKEVKEAAFRSPNTNAFVERFIQTLQQECLDYFIVFGQEHMDHLVNEFMTHYHEERPHQAKDNSQLVAPSSKPRPSPGSGTAPDESADLGIVCRQRLGGLLKSYSRRAA